MAYGRASADSPAYRCPSYATYQPMRSLVADCLQGTPTMRAKAAEYLPRGPAEEIPEWTRRVKRTEFFNGMLKTLRGLVGMVFRKNPRLGKDVPKPIVQHWENIDQRGNHGDVFSRSVFKAGMGDGFSAILVDYPDVPQPDQLTLADEVSLELRPYWIKIEAHQILSWRVEYERGRAYLAQLVIEECPYVPEGQFGGKTDRRYRVFRRSGGVVTWEVWKETTTPNSSGESYVRINGGVVQGSKNTPLKEIPLSICYCAEHDEEFEVIPPLMDLAYTNVAHFQVRSDHRHSLHIASVPLLIFKGRQKADGNRQAVGPNVGIDVAKDGDVKYCEHTGAALTATRNELKDLEGLMAALGLSMLQNESRAAETAEAKRLDKSEQDSALATAARGLQDCLERALQFHAQYMGLTEGTIEVNQEFEHLTLDSGTIDAFSRLHQAGQISLDTLWEMLADGNVLPDEFDADEEKGRIADEMPEPVPPPVVDPNAVPKLGPDGKPIVDPTAGDPTPTPAAA